MAISMDLSQESYTITGGDQGERRLNLLELYTAAVRRGAGNAGLGRRLPVIALAAGLSDVHWNVVQPVHASGPDKHMTAVTMDKIRPAVLRHCLATGQEIGSNLTGVYSFVQDPAALVALPRIVRVRGTG